MTMSTSPKYTASVAAISMVVTIAAGGTARAGEADVIDVTATKGTTGWTFNVTVRHDDKGWEHYADRWDVLAPDGTVLGSRTLLHPHVGEQPFTRSLSGVAIPAGITQVTIRAHDKVHGLGGTELVVDLPPEGSS
jgi:hypothetical protein